MKPEEVIADIVQTNGGPCVMDKLHLPYDHSNSGPAAKFGLGVELYLPNADRSILREQARAFLLDYQQTFPGRVNEFLPADSRRTVKLNGDLDARIRADYEKHPVDDGYGTSLFGKVDIGIPKDDVPPYQAHVLISRSTEEDLSFVTATMPVCGESTAPCFDTLRDAVLRWCKVCRPMHGSAGFALLFASGMSQNTRYALPLMKRFPGFDYIHGVDFSMQARAVHNRIKCVNWLTVLGEEIVTELGGIERIREALMPACLIHDYPGGVVIQAGGAPQLGDTYRSDVPEAYRAVARITRPARFEAYRSRLFRVPDNLDKKEETLAWIRRFD